MGRLFAVILLTGGILSCTFFFPLHPFSTNYPLEDKRHATLSEAGFTYEIEELHTFPRPEEATLSITGGWKSIEFNQKFICYMGSADVIVLEMEKHGKTITIKEIYPTIAYPAGTALYNITGRIQGLKEGDYTIEFVYIDKAGRTTEKLYERSVRVGGDDGDTFVSPTVLGSLGIAIAAITIVTLGMYFTREQRSEVST